MDKIGKVALGMSADAEVIVKTAMKMRTQVIKMTCILRCLISWPILFVW